MDIWLRTQDSAEDALAERAWNRKQQSHIEDFKDYASINKIDFIRDGKAQHRFKDRKNGRFVKGY